jgi:hypothetical protein
MDSSDPLAGSRATVNPYLSGTGMILRRLRWDLRLQSFVSRRRLRRIRDSHAGGRAVILCNGPSLANVDFGELEASGVYCFGLNKINLLFDRVTFRPASIVAVNPYVIEQNAGFFNATDIDLFLDSKALTRGLVTPGPNKIFLHETSHRVFARDVSISIFQGATVTVVALQLAFHMGFSRVALVGADHNFAVKGAANKTVTSQGRDESHFDPNYFSGGVKWQLPDLFESEVWYGRARQVYEAFDRQIVNCTGGGKLEVFERLPLAEFLSGAG